MDNYACEKTSAIRWQNGWTKKTRKETFHKDEINVLLEEVERNKYVIIFTRFKGNHTNKEKQNIW